MIEIQKFLKTPETGQIVKVYLDEKRNFCFGVVKDLYLQSKVSNGKRIKREIVVLRKSKRTYPINEIDFFFDKSLVLFL
jgi:hypothetical protein